MESDQALYWAVTIIIIMGTVTYLNQEVPACVDDTVQVSPVTNYSEKQVNNISEQIESNILVFKTSGSSMEPLISDSEKCVCMKAGSYETGDIVVYFADFGNGFEGIAHKIVYMNITDGEIVTKGVNNNFSDNPIKKENVLCKIPMVKKYTLLGV